MEIVIHLAAERSVAEILSDKVIIHDEESGTDLIGNLLYQDVEGVVLYQQNIVPAFFDLSSGLAGTLLQKFTNYRMRLVIVGDFAVYTSKALRFYIRK